MEANHNYYDDEIDLTEYIKVIWKYKFFILVFTFLAVVISFVVTKRMTPMYSSTVSVIITQESGSGGRLSSVLGGMGFGGLVAGSSDAALIQEVIASRRMRDDTVKALGLIEHYKAGEITKKSLKGLSKKTGIKANIILDKLKSNQLLNANNQPIHGKINGNILNYIFSDRKDHISQYLEKLQVGQQRGSAGILGNNTSVEVGKTKIMSITVEDKSPTMCATIANYYIENLDKLNEELQITTQKPMVQILDKALPALQPFKPKLKLNLLIAMVLGGFGSVFLSFVIEFLRNYKD